MNDMTRNRLLLTVVVPCFNEEEVLPETAKRLGRLLDELVREGEIHAESHVCFVDDGSTDRTWATVLALGAVSHRFSGIRLSRNRGHQTALMAGLLAAKGDIVISVDADLQDDLGAMRGMLRARDSGAEIVYGVRSARDSDTVAKRVTARAFYRLLRWLDVEVMFDHADFRLLSRRVIEALRQYDESNLFLRALIPQLGFATQVVTYERAERFSGISKYPFRKMAGLALDGVTSFSTKPLRLVTAFGCFMSAFSLCLTGWAVFSWLFLNSTIPGWASTVIPIYLVCGVQLLSMGVIGEYVGKIYIETKRRPRFHLSEVFEPVTSNVSRVAQRDAAYGPVDT